MKKFSKTKDNHHDKKAWERAKEEFVTSTMVGASNAPVPTTACVAWVCDPNLMVWQVWPKKYVTLICAAHKKVVARHFSFTVYQ